MRNPFQLEVFLAADSESVLIVANQENVDHFILVCPEYGININDHPVLLVFHLVDVEIKYGLPPSEPNSYMSPLEKRMSFTNNPDNSILIFRSTASSWNLF